LKQAEQPRAKPSFRDHTCLSPAPSLSGSDVIAVNGNTDAQAGQRGGEQIAGMLGGQIVKIQHDGLFFRRTDAAQVRVFEGQTVAGGTLFGERGVDFIGGA